MKFRRYAFVNFVSHQALLDFYERWQGVRLMEEASAKRLNIAVSETQGFEVANFVRGPRAYRDPQIH